jgi:hypothetical protein
VGASNKISKKQAQRGKKTGKSGIRSCAYSNRRRTRWFDRFIPVDLFSTIKTSTAATQPQYFRADR